METKIKLMIQAKPKDTAGWPHINFNYKQAAGQICEALKQRMPDSLIDAAIPRGRSERRLRPDHASPESACHYI